MIKKYPIGRRTTTELSRYSPLKSARIDAAHARPRIIDSAVAATSP